VRFLPFLEKCTENLTHLLTLAHDPNTIRLANCYNSDGNFDLSLLVSAESKPEKDKKKAAAGQKNKTVSVTISESAAAKVRLLMKRLLVGVRLLQQLFLLEILYLFAGHLRLLQLQMLLQKDVRLQKWLLQNTGLLNWQNTELYYTIGLELHFLCITSTKLPFGDKVQMIFGYLQSIQKEAVWTI
jgi:hypothetical protein